MFKNLLLKIKKFFTLTPMKYISQMTDEELIKECKRLYDIVSVFNTACQSDITRYKFVVMGLENRGYIVLGGAAGVNVVKKGDPI